MLGRRIKWGVRLLLLGSLAFSAWFWLAGPDIADDSYLDLDISGDYSEARPSGLLGRLVSQRRTLTDVLDSLKKVRYDGRIRGVVARVGSLDAGWAQTQEIRNALSLVKAEGKRVIALVEVEMAPANKELYLASVADKVYVAPATDALFNGLAAHFVFLGGVWPKVDLKMQVEQIREYKSAGDQLSRESMSEAHREMADALLDDAHSHLVQTLAAARNLTVAEVQALADRCPSRPHDLVTAGLADGVKSRGEILLDLGKDGKKAPVVDESDYEGVSLASLGIGDGPRIAVVHAAGAIQTGESPRGSANAMGSRSIAEAIEDAAEDESITAIVLRVASPGGSPSGSDEIWLQLREAAKAKPVIASLGDVAASGGYYIASAADRILASPGTITGSIGVVLFKPDVSGLLDRVGIHTETLSRGRYARLMDVDKSFDEEELTVVRRQMDGIYQLFLDRVAAGRKIDAAAVDKIGGGRVWTGQQALTRGLIDEIGGLNDAIRAAAAAAGIHDADKVRVVHYPKGGGLSERLMAGRAQAAQSLQPPLVQEITRRLGDLETVLALEPGVQAVLAGVPVIE
ncbi:MAG TPA: signal peptide peptidase SppA [Candidatus Limnocylindrales bacterium]|nr:signal peptide peptidase SppA [Candidatus Limnocylindrales bacterium]